MEWHFLFILGIAGAFGIAHIISTKGIYYNTPDTDNELMADAAAQSNKWRWLSDVHTYTASRRKVAMKEWTIILLSVFQRIFRDRTSDRPYTAMTGLAVSACTVLIYLIVSGYFDSSTGLIIAVLYIISFWPWQVSFYGGHANMANLFFLLSVYMTQISAPSIHTPLPLLIAAGGASIGLCIFCSPSAYKFLPPTIVALFFASYEDQILLGNVTAILESLPANKLIFTDTIIISVFICALFFIFLSSGWVVRQMYDSKAPGFLNKMMQGREQFSLKHYAEHAKRKLTKLSRWAFLSLLSLLLMVNILPASVLITFIAGFMAVFLITYMPHIKDNTLEYFACMMVHRKKSHFKYYIEEFSKIGVTVHKTTRGGDWSWAPRIFWTFTPFHVALFILTLFADMRVHVLAHNRAGIVSLIAVTLISLLPIIWAYATNAPHVSRAYSPGLITGLILPAYVIHDLGLTHPVHVLIIVFIIVTFAWNLWKFKDDIYPARMTVRDFTDALRRLGIRDIYTYRTAINTHLVDAIPGIGSSEYLPRKYNTSPPFHVHRIHRLDEVKNGWIAIPGTDRISMTLPPTANDDYANDPVLRRLINEKALDEIAEIKFKTYSTSNIWSHEDEVTSYCVLYLQGRTYHPYGGYAWLIHSDKLHSILQR